MNITHYFQEVQGWTEIKQQFLNEFHPDRVVHNLQQWITNPLEKHQTTDPIITALWLLFTIWATCFILQVITRNYSWTDKLWSVSPIFLGWYFALSLPLPATVTDKSLSAKLAFIASHHPRLLIMAVLATIWGARLTYNFGRKGGYSLSGEDYRWSWIQNTFLFKSFIGGFLWQVFSFSFIAGYQNILIFWFTTPAYAIYRDSLAHLNEVQGLTVYDYVLAGLYVGLVILEGVADNQQWNYYKRRDAYRKLSKEQQKSPKYAEEARGFNSTGLYAYSRHPNFLAERTLWIVYFFFVVVATGQLTHWSVFGWIQLNICIFPGSTWLTELITSSKYPAYRIYQKYVPVMIPSFTKAEINWDAKKKE